MKLDPFILLPVALAVAIAWTMMFTAGKKRIIELRSDRNRRCPSCGRVIAGRVCDRH